MAMSKLERELAKMQGKVDTRIVQIIVAFLLISTLWLSSVQPAKGNVPYLVSPGNFYTVGDKNYRCLRVKHEEKVSYLYECAYTNKNYVSYQLIVVRTETIKEWSTSAGVVKENKNP